MISFVIQVVAKPLTAFSKCKAVTCFRQMLRGIDVWFVTRHEGMVEECGCAALLRNTAPVVQQQIRGLLDDTFM